MMETGPSREGSTALPLPSLRLLVSPLRLLSAFAWQVVQQRRVLHYDKLADFVALVTEVVPDLLGLSRRAELILGLRARLILELCKADGPANLHRIKYNLEKIQQESGVKTLESSSFSQLVLRLMSVPSEKEYFLKEVFPRTYGQAYDQTLRRLLSEFLSRLEQLLPTPTLTQTAAWLTDGSSAAEEFSRSLLDPSSLETLLLHHREMGTLSRGSLRAEEGNPIMASARPEEDEDSGDEESRDSTTGQSHGWLPTKPSGGRRSTHRQPTLKLVKVHLHKICPPNIPRSREPPIPSTEPPIPSTEPHIPSTEPHIPSSTEPPIPSSTEPPIPASTEPPIPASTEPHIPCSREPPIPSTEPPIPSTEPPIPSTEPHIPSSGRGRGRPQGRRKAVGGALREGRRKENDDGVEQAATPAQTRRRRRRKGVVEELAEEQEVTEEEEGAGRLGAPPAGPKAGDRRFLSARPAIPRHAEEETRCPSCGKTFQLPNQLKTHLRLHALPYRCLPCEKGFGSKSGFYQHQRLHKRGRAFPCSHCPLSFLCRYSLRQHERTHADGPAHLCPECGKRFSAVSMVRHMRMHAGRRDYLCPACGKAFLSSGELLLHTRTHTRDTPYTCTLCGKGFTTKSHLMVHGRSHTGERPYPCAVCPKRFLTVGCLKRHMLSHDGVKPFGCPKCPKEFSQTGNLKKHMSTHQLRP